MGRNEIRTLLKTPARRASASLRSSTKRGKNKHPPVLLALRRWGRFSARNFPSGEERGETDVFAGYEETVKLGFYQLIE